MRKEWCSVERELKDGKYIKMWKRAEIMGFVGGARHLRHKDKPKIISN